jgi:putative hydrolase of the HAD superfamily
MLEQIIKKNSPRLDPQSTDIEARLTQLDGVRAILFDIYGTLFVSGSGDVGTAAAKNTAEALEEALSVAGFEGNLKRAGVVGKDRLKNAILKWHESARNAGIDFPEVEITEVWSTVIEELRLEKLLTGDVGNPDQNQRLALEYECRVNPVFPMPGCLDTLSQLNHRKFTLGIVSNAQFYTPLMFPAFFEKSTEQLNFDPDCCIWSYKELKAKPSSDLFPKVSRLLKGKYGIDPCDTVYVGNDMLNDIYCASEAGCRTVLFAGDRRSLRLRENDERCLAIQPDAVITSLSQLLEIL